jgi:hypothetical protein
MSYGKQKNKINNFRHSKKIDQKILRLLKLKEKNSVVIEKPKNSFVKRGSSFRSAGSSTGTKPASSFSRGAPFKPSLGLKNTTNYK